MGLSNLAFLATNSQVTLENVLLDKPGDYLTMLQIIKKFSFMLEN